MRCRCVFILALCASACAGANEAPVAVTPPTTSPASPEATAAPAPPVDTRTPAAPAPTEAKRSDVVAHDYRKVFDDYASIVFHEGRPLLFAMQGAVDLSTGLVSFEKMVGSGVVYEGDTLWYADGFSPMSACPEPSALVQLQGERWVPRRDVNVHALFVQAWLPGSSLAAVVPMRAGPPWGYELTVLEKNRAAPVPERAGKKRDASCHTRIADLEALVAFPSGEIFAFGTECALVPAETSETDEAETADEQGAPTLVVESWDAKASRSSFASLPFRELSSVRGIGPRDVWVAGSLDGGKHAFAHFDGVSWTLGAERFDDAIHALFVPNDEAGPTARRYFISGGRLLELASQGLVQHAVPNDCQPLGVEVQNGQFWLSCGAKFGMALYTTDPAIAPFAFPAETLQESYVTWREQKLPPLDPKGPRVGCGPRAAEYELESFPSSNVGPKPRPTKPSKPQPSRGGSKVKPPRHMDFGY